MKIEGYKTYANKEALKLARWSLEIEDKEKSKKVKAIADDMETKYRNSNEFKSDQYSEDKQYFENLIREGDYD